MAQRAAPRHSAGQGVAGPATSGRHRADLGASSAGRPRHWTVQVVANVVVIVLLFWALHHYVLESFRIPSDSMEPTLHGCPTCKDDKIIVFKLAYRLHPVHHGDIVVFTRPPGLPVDDRYLVKRVIGLPGETVAGVGGRVEVDGRTVTDAYVEPGCHGTDAFPATTVPAHRLFVMGDDRCDSSDSRVFGTIAEASVVGEAVARVWPPSRVGGV